MFFFSFIQNNAITLQITDTAPKAKLNIWNLNAKNITKYEKLICPLHSENAANVCECIPKYSVLFIFLKNYLPKVNEGEELCWKKICAKNRRNYSITTGFDLI